jgi:N-acylglucosamine-6-phosphate 2-epimerase
LRRVGNVEGIMNDFTKFHSALQGNLIVSCQAPEGSAFCDPASMAHFAGAAVEGGAAGIRANGPGDIHAIRQAVSVPIVGIWKALQDDGRILITPSF